MVLQHFLTKTVAIQHRTGVMVSRTVALDTEGVSTLRCLVGDREIDEEPGVADLRMDQIPLGTVASMMLAIVCDFPKPGGPWIYQVASAAGPMDSQRLGAVGIDDMRHLACRDMLVDILVFADELLA